MKKTVLTLAVAFATIFGFNAAAQNADAQAPAKEKIEQTEVRKDRKAHKTNRSFEGLNLTDDQKAKIQALKTQRADKAKAQAQADKAKKKEAKAKARAEKMQARKDYLASLKSILTPEQYTKFLENNFVHKGDPAKGHRAHDGKHHGKHHKSRNAVKADKGAKTDGMNRSEKAPRSQKRNA